MAFNSPLHDFPIFSPSFFAGKKYSSLGMGNPLLVRGGVLFPISLPPKDPFFNPTFILLIAGKSDDASFYPVGRRRSQQIFTLSLHSFLKGNTLPPSLSPFFEHNFTIDTKPHNRCPSHWL